MQLAITLLAFIVTNIGILTYAHLTSKSSFHFLLLPFIFFPILYVINASFSFAFLTGGRAQLSIVLLLFLNIAVYIVLSLLSNALFWKSPVAPFQWFGVALIIAGSVLVVLPVR